MAPALQIWMTGGNQENERGEPTSKRSWGPINDGNRSSCPFSDEKEIYNTNSIVWRFLPWWNKDRVESSGDNVDILWILVTNIFLYVNWCDFAYALLEYFMLLLGILTRQGVKCGTRKFPETFWSSHCPLVSEAWSYKAIQSHLFYTTGFRTTPGNSNDNPDPNLPFSDDCVDLFQQNFTSTWL